MKPTPSLPVFLPRAMLWWLLISGLVAADVGASAASVLPQRAYLWQRAWTPRFQRSVASDAGDFAGLDVLTVEIAGLNATPQIHRVAVHWPSLVQSGRPTGIVVRVGPYAGAWTETATATRTVLAECRAALAVARENGIEPAELQLDFDAATARLETYRALLQLVRREVQPPKLVITTLPTWLRSAAFAGLIAETDSYVLQVHSLEKPGTIDDTFTLCDPVRAAAWIAQAEGFNHPFRVALPAYGYRLVFDVAGKFVALEAEGPAKNWPADYRRRTAVAEPAEIAQCVQLLLASPPRGCEGLVWFRFPTADDELAWSWPTLRCVMQGRPPEARLVLQRTLTPGGTCDLTLANPGETTAKPTAFRVAWHDARLLASDGLAGWQISRQGPDAVLIKPPPHGSNGALRPGDTLRVGWLRFDRPTELNSETVP